ncbi:Ig-like domain-containing protein [Methanosphaera sp. BMS]|uniref:Ig-like domain-containing protein n=1 Tax=Methanosphaera sp. BMS TaxID=1789762 RepID=UPI0013A6EC66|nr:Ig-like domain-containing protein [Methanosphaera sp. BMS]
MNNDNYAEYGITTYGSSTKVSLHIYGQNFATGTNIILNFTNIVNVEFYNLSNVNLLAWYVYDTGSHQLYIEEDIGTTTISNFYAPNVVLSMHKDNVNVYNSVFLIANIGSGNYAYHNLTFENNTIIAKGSKSTVSIANKALTLNATNITFRNNYMVCMKGGFNSGVVFSTANGANYLNNFIDENNGPFYENPLMLNNSNYNTYFNEDNTLKSEYENSVLFAVENITNPVIINAPVTLTALRGYGGYSTVNFIEGSDTSVIEDSIINKLTLNTVNGIKVNNNKLLDNDSIIEIINSADCIIENNTVNTKNTYTVTFDEDSVGNIVRNNELFASELTGDESVQTTDDNTVKSNMPLPVPELKIDITEFTAGQTATIQASIYLGKEVASDITGGKVVFKINGKTLKNSAGKVIYAKVVNGVAIIEDYTVPASWTNDTIITAVYSGSSKCEALNTTSSITIIKNEPTMTTEDITAAKASTITLTATVKDGDKAITTGKVVFKINGKTVKDANGKVIYAKVDANGVATIPDYTLPESLKTGTYTITAVFTAPNYTKLESNSTLTITA